MITLEGVCFGFILAAAMIVLSVLMWYRLLVQEADVETIGWTPRPDESGEFMSTEIGKDER
jgi:hypothetical protein